MKIIDVEFWEPLTVRLTQSQLGPVVDNDLAEADRLFQQAQEANPALFDGPIVLCNGVRESTVGVIDISWVSSSYRSLALRQLGYRVSSLFVTVLVPTVEGEVVVARAAHRTAKAGRWQLPGGSMEPAKPPLPLTTAHLAAEASRELFEETAITRCPDDLKLWIVSRGEHGNVGVCFIAEPAEAHEIIAAREHLQHDANSELDELRTVQDFSQVDDGDQVDYLRTYLGLYRKTSGIVKSRWPR